MYCNSDCKHHSGLFTGKCNFYGEDVRGAWQCIAVERYSKSPNVEPPIIYKENKNTKSYLTIPITLGIISIITLIISLFLPYVSIGELDIYLSNLSKAT